MANASGTAGGSSNSTSLLDVSSSTQQQPNAVLRVIIDNMIYPVTLDVLFAVGEDPSNLDTTSDFRFSPDTAKC